MKYIFRTVGLLSIQLAVAACSDYNMLSEENFSSHELPIIFSATYPTSSRASDSGFEDGDQMGIFVLDYVDNEPQALGTSDIHAFNAAYQFIGTEDYWKSSSKIYWTSNDTPADIIGYYPYQSDFGTEASLSFTINRRQDILKNNGALGGYEASDLLWTKSLKVAPTSSRIDLTFNHLMAGVRVALLEGKGFSEGEWASLEKLVVIPNILPNTNINIENGTVGVAYGDPVSVSPYQYGSDWRGVVIPQSISAGKNIIDVSVGDEGYHLVKNSSIDYESGKLTSFTITVDKRGDGNLEFSLSDEVITMWLDDVDFREGIVRNYVHLDVKKQGSLKNEVSKSGLSPSSLTGLKLSGEINEQDFAFLRGECTALKNLNLTDVIVWSGDRKNVIPEKAMYKKSTLSRIIFPKNLEIIGSDAFYECGLIGNLVIPEGVTKIGEREFIQDNIGYDNLNYGVFAQCTSLYGELSLPSTLIHIEDNAFAKTSFTGTLNLPDNLITIGNHAFVGNQFSGDLIIPDNVVNIGAGAFGSIPFTGTLVLPKNIKTIYAMTFEGCGFSGVLNLPEGLRNIEVSAFARSNIRGELKLPSTVQRISNRAFECTKISSLVLPDNLLYLGNAAFSECTALRGTVTIPKKVQRICQDLFSGCVNLNEIILHKDILSIGGAAFCKCTNLSRIVCENPEPPQIEMLDMIDYSDLGEVKYKVSPFYGMSLSTVSVEVPKESVNLYKEAYGWSELSRISEYSNFLCRPATACALNTKHTESLVINSEGEWEVVEKPEWCELSKSSGNLKTQILLTIKDLSKGSANRQGKIVFKLKGTDIITECKVKQYNYEYSEDECVTLQKASHGNGVDVVFVGDGWDASSIADGSYLSQVNEQMEAFFGVEPFTSYRDRFNVYALMSLSQETGINTASTWRNTKFSTFYSYDWNMRSSLFVDDADYVFDYAISHSPLTADKVDKSLIILSLNSNEYGSATLLTDKGSAIAICCADYDIYPMDTRGIIQHEACGHAFGKLAEERIIKNKYLPDGKVMEITKYQAKGWYQNISLTGKLSDVSWSSFIYDPRYSDAVDVFEGAYEYTRGVYRAEINSCMNYGIPYFSAPARLDIMRRILEYSGEGFTMEKFYATDSDKWGSTGTTRSAMPDASNAYVNSCMHHPVRIVKSKKY